MAYLSIVVWSEFIPLIAYRIVFAKAFPRYRPNDDPLVGQIEPTDGGSASAVIRFTS
jgi:hypothetical protein